MNLDRTNTKPMWAWVLGAAAIAFGVVTIVAGGRVLFGGDAARAAAGAYVGFVLWFNFLAGFAYIVAGVGLVLWRRWSAFLAALIAAATAVTAVIFAMHILTGGAYEMRTVAAMAFRIGVWTAIAIVACRSLGCRPRTA
jgi:hypothetical protein